MTGAHALGLRQVGLPGCEQLAELGVVGGGVRLDFGVFQDLIGSELVLVEGDVGDPGFLEVVADVEVELDVGETRLSGQQLDELLARAGRG